MTDVNCVLKIKQNIKKTSSKNPSQRPLEIWGKTLAYLWLNLNLSTMVGLGFFLAHTITRFAFETLQLKNGTQRQLLLPIMPIRRFFVFFPEARRGPNEVSYHFHHKRFYYSFACNIITQLYSCITF